MQELFVVLISVCILCYIWLHQGTVFMLEQQRDRRKQPSLLLSESTVAPLSNNPCKSCVDPILLQLDILSSPFYHCNKKVAIYGQHRLDVGKMVSFCVKALTFSFLTATVDRSTVVITNLLYCTHSYSLHNFCQYFQAVLRFEPQLEDLMIISSSPSCLLLLHTPADSSAAPPGYFAANARKRFTLQGLSNRRSLPAGNSSTAHVSPRPPHHLLSSCLFVLLSVTMPDTIWSCTPASSLSVSNFKTRQVVGQLHNHSRYGFVY